MEEYQKKDYSNKYDNISCIFNCKQFSFTLIFVNLIFFVNYKIKYTEEAEVESEKDVASTFKVNFN